MHTSNSFDRDTVFHKNLFVHRHLAGRLFMKKFLHTCFIFFIACMPVFDIPAVQSAGPGWKAWPPYQYGCLLHGFMRQLFCPVLHTPCNMKCFNSFFQRNHLCKKIEFLIGLSHFLCLFQYFQTLKIQALYYTVYGHNRVAHSIADQYFQCF